MDCFSLSFWRLCLQKGSLCAPFVGPRHGFSFSPEKKAPGWFIIGVADGIGTDRKGEDGNGLERL